VSAFRGKSKKSAWQTWDVCPEASYVFTKLSCYPTDVEEDDTVMLEKFVITMYDRSSSTVAVDDARLELFARKRDPTTPFPQLEQLLFSISDELHTRQHVYGGGLWCANLKRRVLLNGDGNKKETAGAPNERLLGSSANQ